MKRYFVVASVMLALAGVSFNAAAQGVETVVGTTTPTTPNEIALNTRVDAGECDLALPKECLQAGITCVFSEKEINKLKQLVDENVGEDTMTVRVCLDNK